MTPKSIVPWVALAAFTACTAEAPDESTQVEEVAASGDLVVAGCTPSAHDLIIAAAPVEAVDPQQQRHRRNAVIAATIAPTQNPHRFRVTLGGLRGDTVYRLSAYSTSQACQKLAWKGPRGGWLTPGAHEPLRIEAYAMRTQTEVLAVRDQQPVWVGSEAIDLRRQDTTRMIRWRTDVPGAVAGVVQVALSAFPVGPAAQQQQVPVIASWQVPLPQQGWGEVPIDFGALAQCDLSQNPNGCPFTTLEAAHREIQQGAPMHVRIVPIDNNGALLGDTLALGIAAEIHVAHLPNIDVIQPPPPPPVPPLDYHIQYQRGWPEMASSHTAGCYMVTKSHPAPAITDYFSDPWGWKMAYKWHKDTVDGNFFVGEAMCLDVVGGSWLDDIVDAVSGLIDAIGTMVDKIAKVYDEIKKAVVAAAASAIEFVGIPCEGECQMLLETALNTGLAAMGLPPSLPNWNELVERGTDYLVEAVVEETGLPEAAVELVVDKIKEDISKDRGIPEAPGWVVAIDGFFAPQMTLDITKDPTSAEPMPGALEFAPSRSFVGSLVVLPKHALEAGRTVRIPVTLLPNFAGIPRATSCDPIFGIVCGDASPGIQQLHYEHEWFEHHYADAHCQDIRATGLLSDLTGRTRFFFPGPGIQLQWHISTLGFHDSDEEFLFDCPP